MGLREAKSASTATSEAVERLVHHSSRKSDFRFKNQVSRSLIKSIVD
jgi:hypothetical protein